MEQEYIYRKRAVAFLDVLGFRQKLIDFEKEALANHLTHFDDANNENLNNGQYISSKANDFINTFKKAITKLDVEKYKYYLFSDNICITSIRETSTADLQDLLLVITELYFEFAQKGYFLRGGIDYGLFIDEKELAVGIPLANAYELETKVAVYPRIILSTNLVNEFQAFNNKGEKVFDYLYSDVLILDSCEIKYLNVFLQVFQSDYREDREAFFKKYNNVIVNNLEENKTKEIVYIKYKWLAEQFNDFIDLFIIKLAFLDSDFNPEDEVGFIEFVKHQKIKYGN
ncbi:MAG: hypothetical protein EHM93_11230 [Bacteroidales bacterium]|nr:MAG: hypothetical protein EHM93_11230 [Bacteroidales bacterium]